MPWYEEAKIVAGKELKDFIWLSDKRMPVIPDDQADVMVIINGRVLPPDMWAKGGPRNINLAPMTPGTTWHVRLWFDRPVAVGATYETPGEHMDPVNLNDPKVQQMIDAEKGSDGGYR